MADKVAAQPELYSISSAHPALNGMRCVACGYVFFPPQTYGCESCGAPADKLEPAQLAGSGVLNSFATVHHHAGKGIETPFTVGVIVLDDGPAVRSLLIERTDAGLRNGDRMHSVLTPCGKNDDGTDLVELRFEKAEA
jgi:uncharacterized OB-fold protein